MSIVDHEPRHAWSARLHDGFRSRVPKRILGPLLGTVDVAAALASALVVVGLQAVVGRRVLDVSPVLLLLGMIVGVPLFFLAAGLYQRRRCAIGSVEISRIGQVSVLGALVMLGLLQAGDSTAPYTSTAIVIGFAFVALVMGRGSYRSWVRQARIEGRFLTPVALVGDALTVGRFAERLQANPDGGYVAVAHIDVDDGPSVRPSSLPRAGHVDDDLDALVSQGVHSVVVLTPHLSADDLNRAVRSLQRRFDHVQVVTSLSGVAHSRLVPTPLIDETSFYLEPAVASGWQRSLKRAVDVVLSTSLLLMSLPLLMIAAAIIKLSDGGPVLYAQRRIGQHGRLITILKLRSMVPEAESLQADLDDSNERGGPLFKARCDPRITPIGRFLRATSIDELPQLWAILRGDMSLVGPRPALPAEVARFDDIHRRRHEVKPGLTGLWQVEDRDHPDFERYRRHDVFYIENWSLALDFAILLQTAVTVIGRAVRFLVGRSSTAAELA